LENTQSKKNGWLYGEYSIKEKGCTNCGIFRGGLDWIRRDNDTENGLDYLENHQGVDYLRNDPKEGLDYLKK
jgi:hypothetical protein